MKTTTHGPISMTTKFTILMSVLALGTYFALQTPSDRGQLAPVASDPAVEVEGPVDEVGDAPAEAPDEDE